MPPPRAVSPRPRLLAVDCARGIALVGMVVFHVAWDLHYFGFSSVDPNVEVVLHGLGHAVAGAFLFVSGFGLVLAAEGGTTWRRDLTRLLRIGAAALAVTLVSWLLAPAQPILFGILHCVFATNCVALALRRRPVVFLLALAAAGLSLPVGLRDTVVGPAWTWLGLGAAEPDTLDFRPFFPWISAVLLGVAAARTAATRLLEGWRPNWPIARWLGTAGRHSLAIYLAHQPIVFAVLYLVATASGLSRTPRFLLSDPAEAAAFLQQCSASCIAKGKDPQLCRSTCHCVMTDLLGARQAASGDGIDRASRACLAPDGDKP